MEYDIYESNLFFAAQIIWWGLWYSVRKYFKTRVLSKHLENPAVMHLGYLDITRRFCYLLLISVYLLFNIKHSIFVVIALLIVNGSIYITISTKILSLHNDSYDELYAKSQPKQGQTDMLDEGIFLQMFALSIWAFGATIVTIYTI